MKDKRCPVCGMSVEETAQKCECGFDFTTYTGGTVNSSPKMQFHVRSILCIVVASALAAIPIQDPFWQLISFFITVVVGNGIVYFIYPMLKKKRLDKKLRLERERLLLKADIAKDKSKCCPRCGRPMPEYAVSCKCGFSYADPKSNTPYHPEEAESKHIKKGEFGIQVKQLLVCLGLLAIPSAIQVALSNTGLILGAIPVILLYTPSLALIVLMKKGKWGPQFKEKKTTGLDKPVNIVSEHSQDEKTEPKESAHQSGVELLEQLRDEMETQPAPDPQPQHAKKVWIPLCILCAVLASGCITLGVLFYNSVQENLELKEEVQYQINLTDRLNDDFRELNTEYQEIAHNFEVMHTYFSSNNSTGSEDQPVFVYSSATNSKIYHNIDCNKHSDRLMNIYDRNLAEWLGYSACPNCCGLTLPGPNLR